jgi:predicted metal-dependent TIM-barrel fold hydrolase
MEEYIVKPRVVGVGEAGMDTITVGTRGDRVQGHVDFARDHDKPIIVHNAPPRHSPFMGREKADYDKRKVHGAGHRHPDQVRD